MNNNRIDIVNNSMMNDLSLSYGMKRCPNHIMQYQDVSFFLKNVDARIQGLVDIVKHHGVIVNGNSFKALRSASRDENIVKLSLQLSINNVNKATKLLNDGVLDPLKAYIYSRSTFFKCLISCRAYDGEQSQSCPAYRGEEPLGFSSPRSCQSAQLDSLDQH